MSYLQGIVLDHYIAILCFNPGHSLITNWQAFVNKFSSKFGVYNTVAEAERKLASLKMSTDERFTMFVVQFEKEAYETGWNYNALRFQLSKALSKPFIISTNATGKTPLPCQPHTHTGISPDSWALNSDPPFSVP
ncbi:hypothetical protein C0995_016088 [Termitomyces sp. Mi166|nr:hypothetical protein C0995_016088 [Termitomyces sp. Mi166\